MPSEISQSRSKSTAYHIFGNIVPALRHTLTHALPGDVEIGNPKKIQPDAIARRPPGFEQRRIGPARQRGLKGKVHPLRRQFPQPVQHDPSRFERRLQADLDAGLALNAAMRRLRNLTVCTLIERDLAGRADLAEVVVTMTEFADFAVQTHLAALMAEQCALYGVPIGEESGRQQQMIVLGMGKLGGGELNVSSDIDLIFVYPEDGDTRAAEGQKQLSNHEFFVRLGKKLIGALAEITEDGFTFRVDMALRPNGNSGPLAAGFNMVEEYLVRQGREAARHRHGRQAPHLAPQRLPHGRTVPQAAGQSDSGLARAAVGFCARRG